MLTGWSSSTKKRSRETQLDLSWTEYQGSDFDRYEIRRATSPGVTTSSTLITTIATKTTTSYTNTGLTQNTTYCYRVFVYDTSPASSGSNEISAKTSETGAPQAVTLDDPEIPPGTLVSQLRPWCDGGAAYAMVNSWLSGPPTDLTTLGS